MISTPETVANCLAFANSTKNAVGFAMQVAQADAIRAEILAGDHAGCSFPKAKKPRPYNSPYSQEQRRHIVSCIHSLRIGGEKARLAAKSLDISYQTYSRWIDEENMPYDGPCLRGDYKRRRRA